MSDPDYLQRETKNITDQCHLIEEQTYAIQQYIQGARMMGLHEMADTLTVVNIMLNKAQKSINASNGAIVSGMYRDTIQSTDNMMNAVFASIKLQAGETHEGITETVVD